MPFLPAFTMSKQVARSLARGPATRRYPFEPRTYTAGTRGHISIEVAKCILCVLCDKKCPTQAIRVDRAAKTWAIDRLRCIQCGVCVDVCPKKCLGMENTYAPSATVKAVETLAIPFTPPAPKPPAAPPPAREGAP
jgi:ech hydrogenase subunit F